MIRPAAAFLIGASLCPPFATAAEQSTWPEWIEQSRQLSMQLGQELKSELGRAIEQGGPIAAIDVCHKRAPEIAGRLSAHSGATVGRTALRVRNAANAPDEMQRAVLQQFAGELTSGRAEGPLEAVFEINHGGRIERRYMRAIPTEALCLTCHGEVLAPGLAAAIASRYPGDQATGFKQGDLRGAFSVIWPALPAPAAR